MGHDIKLFVDEICDAFICHICNDVLGNPILIENDTVLACASCVDNLAYTDEERASHRVAPSGILQELSILQVRCPLVSNGCKCITNLAQLDHHVSVCKFVNQCSDMDELWEQTAHVEVDEAAAHVEGILNDARVSYPEIVYSETTGDVDAAAIHAVSLALFSGFDIPRIERTSETSLSSLLPEFIWKVTLKIEEDGDNMQQPMASGSRTELVHLKFGKLHTFAWKKDIQGFQKLVKVTEFKNIATPSDSSQYNIEDIVFGDSNNLEDTGLDTDEEQEEVEEDNGDSGLDTVDTHDENE